MSAATILSLNVVSPFAGLGEEGRLRLTKLFVVVVGIAAWAVAGFQEGIIASLLLAYTIFVGGVALPTLASFWRDRLRVNSRSALWAIALGGTTAFLGGFREGALLEGLLGPGGVDLLSSLLGPEFGSLLPLVLSALALLVGSAFGPRPEDGP